MSNTWPPEFEKTVLQWILTCRENNNGVGIKEIKSLTESLGILVSTDKKPAENKENADPQLLAISTIVDNPETKVLQEVSVKDPLQEPAKSPLISSPQMEQDFSVILATSSPIKQTSKASDKLLTIIKLAKELLEVPGERNATYTNPPFVHKRISDIKISPLALAEQQRPEINVTMTKDVPSIILKSTPKKKAMPIVKTEEKKSANTTRSDDKTPITLSGVKKSLLQPVQSKFQTLQSKLRTPTNLRNSSPSLTKSAGARTTLTPVERRLSTTPQRRETPTGLSRLKYPSTLRK